MAFQPAPVKRAASSCTILVLPRTGPSKRRLQFDHRQVVEVFTAGEGQVERLELIGFAVAMKYHAALIGVHQTTVAQVAVDALGGWRSSHRGPCSPWGTPSSPASGEGRRRGRW